jgi:hypothetical protein
MELWEGEYQKYKLISDVMRISFGHPILNIDEKRT